MTTSNYPQWSTPDRRTRLLKLWARYNNQCLLGHQACTNPAHYVQTDVIMGYVSHGQAVKRELCNSNGQQLKFNDGTPAYYIDIPISKKPVQVSRTIRRYDYLAESIIKEWIREDRDVRNEKLRLERKLLHETNDRTFPLRGQFSAVSRDIYYGNQPAYFIETIGLSGLTLRPFARIRLASSNTRLYVDISCVLKPISRHKKRKALRYGKVNTILKDRLETVCALAVRDYLK